MDWDGRAGLGVGQRGRAADEHLESAAAATADRDSLPLLALAGVRWRLGQADSARWYGPGSPDWQPRSGDAHSKELGAVGRKQPKKRSKKK